jgi:DNA polymerase
MDLKELKQEVSNCTLCNLSINRKTTVFSKGNENADIMICGMCPGPDENSEYNEHGYPFIGRAGRHLDEILEDVGLSLDDVYITNVVKCFLQPGIRLEDDWIDSCFPYLVGQISNVNPKVIIALGADAGRSLLNVGKSFPLSSMRGRVYNFTYNIKLFVTYHPSYFLRAGGRKHQHYNKVLEDFEFIKTHLREK